MASDRSHNKGELLNAFIKGDGKKVLQLTYNIPGDAKSSIAAIIKNYKECTRKIIPLIEAVIHGNYHLCRLLLEDGASPSEGYKNQPGPLSLALRDNQSDIAELLIQSGADVNKLEDDNNTYPLFWAIIRKHPPRIIQQIISAGFPVNGLVKRKEQLTGVHCAALKNNNIEVIELLIKNSADLNVKESGGHTALNIAIRMNFFETVKLLANNGTNLNDRNTCTSPLLLAIKFERIKMVEVLLDLGVNIQEGWLGTETISPLHFAIRNLNVGIVMLLIARGANVNAKIPITCETPLHLISNCSSSRLKGEVLDRIQVNIAKALIAKGASINVANADNRTPLDIAISIENSELCKLLMREGAEICFNHRVGFVMFVCNRFEYITCVKGLKCPELIRMCLEHGSDYKSYDKYGLSLYHYALAKHKPDMVKVFWQFGCPYDLPELIPGKMKAMLSNFKSRDKKLLKIQAEFIAGIKNGKLDVVVNALKKGAEAKGCSVEIPSTLHYVADIGNHQIAQLLLENGVPVNTVNEKGLTPLHIAIQKRHFQICKTLLKFGACFKYHHAMVEKNKTLEKLIQEDEPLQRLFKEIHKCFRLAQQGNSKLIKVLKKFKRSGDEEMLQVLMNCVNNKGLTLMGTALAFKYADLGKNLMHLRLENM